MMLLAIGMFCVTSCEKTNFDNDKMYQQSTSKTIPDDDGWGLHNKLVTINGEYECIPEPFDCFDEILITIKDTTDDPSTPPHKGISSLDMNVIKSNIEIYATNYPIILDNLKSEDYSLRELPSAIPSKKIYGLYNTKDEEHIVYSFQFAVK